jgi:hypothetical protein
LCHLQHKLIGFYNRDEKCLQHGTEWIFKESGLPFVFKGLKRVSCSGAMDGSTMCFCCEGFYKNGDSFVIAQREFRREFGIHHNPAVPSAHAIKTWVRNFELTGSTLKRKGGIVKTVRTPKNIAVVREAIERSPHRSACHHSMSLGLSEASVRRVLHKHLHFYPNKIQVTHALHERDSVNRVNFCQTFLQLVNQNQEPVSNL